MKNYNLDIEQRPDRAIKGLTTELINETSDLLRSREFDPVKVHEVRKCLKRLRALLRLVRLVLPLQQFDEADLFFQQKGKALSDIRDVDVLRETLDRLSMDENLEETTEIIHLRKKLDEKYHPIANSTLKSGSRKRLARELRLYRRKVKKWKLRKLKWEVALDGLVNVHQKSQRGYLEIDNSLDAVHVHTWRKQMKHQQYMIEFFTPAFPSVLKPLYSTLDEITDALGKHHDLAVLNGYLQKENALEWLPAVTQHQEKYFAEAVRKSEKYMQINMWDLKSLILSGMA